MSIARIKNGVKEIIANKVTPDWNQANPNAPDFIKNKPVQKLFSVKFVGVAPTGTTYIVGGLPENITTPYNVVIIPDTVPTINSPAWSFMGWTTTKTGGDYTTDADKSESGDIYQKMYHPGDILVLSEDITLHTAWKK